MHSTEDLVDFAAFNITRDFSGIAKNPVQRQHVQVRLCLGAHRGMPIPPDSYIVSGHKMHTQMLVCFTYAYTLRVIFLKHLVLKLRNHTPTDSRLHSFHDSPDCSQEMCAVGKPIGCTSILHFHSLEVDRCPVICGRIRHG